MAARAPPRRVHPPPPTARGNDSLHVFDANRVQLGSLPLASSGDSAWFVHVAR